MSGFQQFEVSVLPPELEKKRAVIARSNFLRAMLIIGGLFGPLLLLAWLFRHDQQHRRTVMLICIAALLPAELYAITRQRTKSNEHCRHLGFICPHCGSPLFAPRSTIQLTGMCPACGRSVLR
jgi:hypothetical protein